MAPMAKRMQNTPFRSVWVSAMSSRAASRAYNARFNSFNISKEVVDLADEGSSRKTLSAKQGGVTRMKSGDSQISEANSSLSLIVYVHDGQHPCL